MVVQSFHPTSRSLRCFVVDVANDSGGKTNKTDGAQPADPTQQQTILQDF